MPVPWSPGALPRHCLWAPVTSRSELSEAPGASRPCGNAARAADETAPEGGSVHSEKLGPQGRAHKPCNQSAGVASRTPSEAVEICARVQVGKLHSRPRKALLPQEHRPWGHCLLARDLNLPLLGSGDLVHFFPPCPGRFSRKRSAFEDLPVPGGQPTTARSISRRSRQAQRLRGHL